MFIRSGMYYAAQHMQEQHVRLPPFETENTDPGATFSHEELQIFLRLWGVILAGVAVILGGSWLIN